MKVLILLHSTTGNTRLMARYSAARLHQAGAEVTLQDIVREPEWKGMQPDLLLVACPVMYFRPTLAMERFLANMPRLAQGTTIPAALLATCAGEPGATMPILIEALAHKGYKTVAARHHIAPTNWPAHLNKITRLEPLSGVGARLADKLPKLRPLWGSLWLEGGQPNQQDKVGLDAFLDDLMAKKGFEGPGLRVMTSGGTPLFNLMGRFTGQYEFKKSTNIEIDPEKCDGCGTCIKVCSMGCLTRDPGGDKVPRLTEDCSGCWACFNHCTRGAIRGFASPAGSVRYTGPSQKMKALFKS